MRAKRTLAEGKKTLLLSEALKQFLLEREIEGKSKQTLFLIVSLTRVGVESVEAICQVSGGPRWLN